MVVSMQRLDMCVCECVCVCVCVQEELVKEELLSLLC